MNIYIHIPFCKTRCCYCDFFTTVNINKKSKIVECINKEINDRIKNLKIKNIYIGGGTPSLLNIEEIIDIFNNIYKQNTIDNNAEITFEANPDDLNNSYISNITNYTPINRVSMGVQSFISEDLIFLNRRHSDIEVQKAVEALTQYGITNISMDLIYGLPNQTKQKWEYNIKKMISLKPKHISAYHLTYEKGTVLYNKLMKGEIKEVSEDDSFIFFNSLIELLSLNGYEQYEISNFSLKGYNAKLNSDYWNGSPYIGIGPSAHSYDGNKTRRFNIPNIRTYIENVGSNNNYYSFEYLTDNDIINEFIMTRLRTKKGIEINELKKIANDNICNDIIYKSKKYSESGHIKISNNNISLTKKGIFISDNIISDLFVL